MKRCFTISEQGANPVPMIAAVSFGIGFLVRELLGVDI
jgi:hypothetical protein